MKRISLALAALALPFAAPAQAATALDLLVPGDSGFSSETRGFAFTLDQAIVVDGLGWYDHGNDGLANSHAVAIWSDGGLAQLLSGTVSSGVVDPLVDRFRYSSSLAGSTLLGPGTYVIGGLSTEADRSVRRFDVGEVAFGPGVTYLEDRTNGAGAFSFPATHDHFDIGYFGPNFSYSLASGAVPEPATWALMLLGFGMVGGALRSRNRKTAAKVSVA